MKKTLFLGLLNLLLIIAGCKQNDSNNMARKTGNTNQKESMIEANSVLVDRDAELIESYVERRGWTMEVSTTGLWYMIYKETAGIKARQGMRATIHYRVELLDGTLCYDSGTRQPKTFKIGQGGVESGLEQGILMMREGERAKFIMAPYLAHGLLGDENKIPPRAIIVYDVHLTELK